MNLQDPGCASRALQAALLAVFIVLLLHNPPGVEGGSETKVGGQQSPTEIEDTNTKRLPTEASAVVTNAERPTTIPAFLAMRPTPSAILTSDDREKDVTKVTDATGEWIAETTEGPAAGVSGGVNYGRVLGTRLPRHGRSTTVSRRSKVFLDPAFYHYPVSWITNSDTRNTGNDNNDDDNNNISSNNNNNNDGSGDETVEDEQDRVNIMYTWTPTSSSSSSSSYFFSSSSSSSSLDSAAITSAETTNAGDAEDEPTLHSVAEEEEAEDNSLRALPTKAWGRNPGTAESTYPQRLFFPGLTYPREVTSKVKRKSGEMEQLERREEEAEEEGGGLVEDHIEQEALQGDDRVLYIGGIFELTRNSHAESARSELDAAQLAIRHVNVKRVVPGYRLQLVFNDSQCDAGVGTDVFYDMIYRMTKGRHITMVMGSACAEVTKTLAEIVPYWNLILISYAATSPALGDREKYKTFFRLALADSSLVPARRMFINYMKWRIVAVLYEDIEKYSLAMNAIGEDFAVNNITISATLSFKDAAVEIPEQLQELKSLDIRIILAAFSVATARQVFCEAYHQGLFGRRYVWLLMGGFKPDSWWKDARGTNCTAQQLAKAVEGCFAVVSLNTLLGGKKSIANLTTTEFEQAYHADNGSVPMSFFAATTYDTVWTIAFTLRKAIQRWQQGNGTAEPGLHTMNYSDLASVRDTYIDIIKRTHFDGVSGPVSFKGSDREGVSVIYQLQGGNFSRVAIHYPDTSELNFHCDGCRPIVWQGGKKPRDKKIVVPRQKTIEATIFYISTACCGAGIVMALVFLQYNLYHRKLKYIKLSSPKLNNVGVIGCILVYATVVLMGLDDRTMPADVFSVVCTVRGFLLAAGFSLAFGAMFAKTFRVHQIFTRAHHGLVKSKLLRDRHLLFLVGGLLVLDSGVVCVWVIVDPMRRHVTNLTMESSEDDEDLVFLTQLATCHSHHLQKWMGVFYAYKGLLLLFGVYMAWETRNVKIPALNDSQYIGFNVYNVVLMSVCVVVLSNILSSQPTLSYAIESAFIVLSTTVTLCLLFVPKIYVIVTSGGDPVIASTGILVEANTRRFVVDEKKEMYYRAEVQNRVYKRELVELDQEIHRLERLLELSVDDYPKLSEDLLFMLPESTTDCTAPTFQLRRNNRALDRCNSISDGGEGVSVDKEENQDVLRQMGASQGHCDTAGQGQGQHQEQLNLNTVPPYGKRYSAQDHASSSAFKTLRRFSRSLSIGHGSHFKWKLRKSGIPARTDTNHHHRVSTGRCSGPGARDEYSVAGDDSDDMSLSFSSPPVSPSSLGKGTSDKARFAVLLRDELVAGGQSSDLLLGKEGVNLLDVAIRRRAMSLSSASSDGDHHVVIPPTVNKVTQTSFGESPVSSRHRVGHVFRVDKLEVIELDDQPRRASRCSGNNNSAGPPSSVPPHHHHRSYDPVTLGEQQSTHAAAADNAGEKSTTAGNGTADQTEYASDGADKDEETQLLLTTKSVQSGSAPCSPSRPDSFPETLSCPSPDVPLSPTGSHNPGVPCSPVVPHSPNVLRSPCSRKGIAVHFSPYNEIRFVDKASLSDTFFQEATNPSSSSNAYRVLPSSPLPACLACSDTPPDVPRKCHVKTPGTQSNPPTDRTNPGSASRDGDSVSGKHSARSKVPPAQTVIDTERRKRIRKLQQDLQRIQRELQDIDDLEYDVTEV